MFKTLTTLSSFLFISSLENNNNQNNNNQNNNNNVDFNLPSIDFNDILTMNKDTSKDLISYLTSIGGIQIINIPKFNEIKEKGLNKLSECLLSDTNKIETIMKDGKKRLTIGAPNYNGIPQEMESYCGIPAGDLRSTIDSTTRLLLNLLDKSIPINAQKQDLITPYQTFTELASNGDHLEHLHSYYSSNEFSKSDSYTYLENENQKILSSNKITYTMDLHTDSGLFIAMTNGYYKPLSSSTSSSSSSTSKLNNIHSNIQQNNGLYIQLSSGEIVRTYTDPDSLIFMIGQGASDWLSPIFGTKLRALPHALSADLSNGMTRSWYGKMYLPPSDALLPEYDGTRLSYSSYRVRELSASTFAAKSKDFKISEYLPSACGMMESSHKLLEMVQNTLCDNGNGVYCWQQCYPLSDYSCGAQAECIDTATGEPVDGTIMCPSAAGMGACEVQCPIAKNSSSNDFCWGAGTDMYMDGFTSIVQEEDGSTACLNLFFKEWTLNNKTKYGFACIGVFFLGVLVEFLTSFRKSLWKQLEKGHLRNIILMFLHCIQLCVGYFLMLAAMTYNVEIFCMVLAGVGVGHAIFNINEPPQGTDHCCAGANESLLDSKKSLH